jgi:hypothetical protein
MMQQAMPKNLRLSFPIANNKANKAYHIPGHPLCGGFFTLVDDIASLGFFTRKVNEKNSQQN